MSIIEHTAKTVSLTEGSYALANRLWQGVPSIQWPYTFFRKINIW